ncbi:hypothetical protein [Hankyongella ginsenosidimutans]|uniref:hypothetical protein n=1 Tax=Hankyongella ginsenosidimutans TaxID=1763828 RepID=UPI001FEB9F77|nr:hypothetical protein [Hankyongella ginsenosidimutans]
MRPHMRDVGVTEDRQPIRVQRDDILDSPGDRAESLLREPVNEIEADIDDPRSAQGRSLWRYD